MLGAGGGEFGGIGGGLPWGNQSRVFPGIPFGEATAEWYAQEFSVAASNEGTRVLRKRLLPEDGYLAVPDGPGLGVELDDDEVERMSRS